MAKPKPKTSEVENRLTGEKAKIVYDPTKNRATITKSSIAPTETSEAEKKKNSTSKAAKTEAKPKVEKPKLKELEQKVLSFLESLNHPATSNEVRDEFKFPLRQNARTIFKKLAKLGYGENRKTNEKGRRYRFYVKDKEYPPPKTEPPKVKPKVKEKAK